MRLRTFRSVLDECLAALQRGETVESCARRYPKQADRLRPLLSLAERVQRTPQAVPRPWAEATAWHVVRQRALELRTGKRRRRMSGDVNWSAWLRPVAAAMALLFALTAAAGGTALASQGALPGDRLYGVKLLTEDLHVMVTFDDTDKAGLLLDQSDERMEEMTTLVRQGRQIPAKALTSLENRNDRAFKILAEHTSETSLWSRALAQAETQEHLLIGLWPEVEEEARPAYTQTVADIHNVRLGGLGGEVVSELQPDELANGVLKISGVPQRNGDGSYTIGGLPLRIDHRTIGASSFVFEQGARATFTVGLGSNNRLYALSISGVIAGEPPTGSIVSGEVAEVSNEGIRLLSGQFIPMTPETIVKLDLRPGGRVQVNLGKTEKGVVAEEVTAAPEPTATSGTATFIYEGSIQGDVTATLDEWTIGGLPFRINTSNTQFDFLAGDAKDGARAVVKAVNERDGVLQAQSVTIVASSAPADSAYFVGTFQGTRTGIWVVSGQDIAPKQGWAEPIVGSVIAVELEQRNGALTGKQLSVVQTPDQPEITRVHATVTQIEDTIWTTEVGEIRVAARTARVSGRPQAGTRTVIWGREGSDEVFEAVFVRVLDQEPVIEALEAGPMPEVTPTAPAQ